MGHKKTPNQVLLRYNTPLYEACHPASHLNLPAH